MPLWTEQGNIFLFSVTVLSGAPIHGLTCSGILGCSLLLVKHREYKKPKPTAASLRLQAVRSSTTTIPLDNPELDAYTD